MPLEEMFPVIDLFAGPGGLSEGFARFGERDWEAVLDGRSGRGRGGRGSRRVFRVALSIEKDPAAHATLLLRSFFRTFDPGCVPGLYYDHLRGRVTRDELFAQYPAQARRADEEAWCAELGDAGPGPEEIDRRIRRALGGREDWVLIGGPPCQAYSLVGRARRRGIPGYTIESDARHALYREYLRIVARHAPPVFVMENVKGLLSATVHGQAIFERIIEDLREPGRAAQMRDRRTLRYRLCPIAACGRCDLFGRPHPADFVVRMERHGIPQTRHRVILLGIREDLAGRDQPVLVERPPVRVGDVIGDLPRLRSGLCPRAWLRPCRGWYTRSMGARAPSLTRLRSGRCDSPARWGRARNATVWRSARHQCLPTPPYAPGTGWRHELAPQSAPSGRR